MSAAREWLFKDLEPRGSILLSREFPLLWEHALQADYNGRLGRPVDPLDQECEAALREIWMARRAANNLALGADAHLPEGSNT